MIEELRRIGQEALQGWAKRRQEIVEQVAEADSALSRKEKKTLPAQLLRGNLGNRADLSSRSWRSATTPVCRRAGDSLSRVFVTSAVVLTDFGAESSFGKAVERVKEHYRIQEARLALARMPDSVTARFGVTMGAANDTGNQLTA